MWAVVVKVDITDLDDARASLDEVVASVRQAPGFVSGYWIQLDDGHGISLAVFDAEESQVRARAPEIGSTERGVTFTGVEFGEVLAYA